MRMGCCIVFCLISPVLLANEIYRSLDAQGQPRFSDRPSANAKRIPQPARPYQYRYLLEHVIDGDTVIVKPDRRVRLVGINTPEVSHRQTTAEPGGEEARDWLRKRLDGSQITLEYDQQKHDKYQRELAYVYRDKRLINAELLAEGLAVLTLRPPNLRYSQQLQAAQQKAEKQQKGLWKRPRYQPVQAGELPQHEDYRGWRRWQMTPRKISPGGDYLDLIVSDDLKIRIHKSEQDYFADATDWLDKRLEVRGWMSRRGEQYAIRVYHPSSVIVLD